MNALKRINKVQTKYIDNYDKENQITEKLDMLKNEIKQNKDAISSLLILSIDTILYLDILYGLMLKARVVDLINSIPVPDILGVS